MQNMKLDMQQFIKNLESNGVIIKNKKTGQKIECIFKAILIFSLQKQKLAQQL